MEKEIKLTNEEKIILKNFDGIEEFKYIARDEDGSLFAYKSKPYQRKGNWRSPIGGKSMYIPFSKLFKFITWEDTKPYKIEDLLKED